MRRAVPSTKLIHLIVIQLTLDESSNWIESFDCRLFIDIVILFQFHLTWIRIIWLVLIKYWLWSIGWLWLLCHAALHSAINNKIYKNIFLYFLVLWFTRHFSLRWRLIAAVKAIGEIFHTFSSINFKWNIFFYRLKWCQDAGRFAVG